MTARQFPDSLTTRVTEYVREKGKARLSEVAQAFPDHTKKQVHDALSNARCRKLLKVIFRGSFKGSRESIWAPDAKDPTPRARAGQKPLGQPVASVWELGNPSINTWPPKFDGAREFNLLGPWTDSEDLASNDSRKAA